MFFHPSIFIFFSIWPILEARAEILAIFRCIFEKFKTALISSEINWPLAYIGSVTRLLFQPKARKCCRMSWILAERKFRKISQAISRTHNGKHDTWKCLSCLEKVYNLQCDWYTTFQIFFYFLQLNKYKTAPNFILLSQNLTSDCFLI